MKKSQASLLLIPCLILFISQTAFTQHSTNTSGSEANGSNGSVSYSIGELLYTSISGSGGIVEQGIQHPYTIYDYSGLNDLSFDISLAAYPNPTSNYLTLFISEVIETLQYQLMDVNGKIIKEGKITEENTQIAMENLRIATYFLRIQKQRENLKVFKIIKN